MLSYSIPEVVSSVYLVWIISAILIALAAIWIEKSNPFSQQKKSPVPVSVNYFPTRLCNKACEVCFHVEKTSYMLLESVSIVTNGSKVTEKWISKYGKYVDIIAVSCDSFNEETNTAIGRRSGDNVKQLRRIRDWCTQYGIKFKMNTVVCKLNWEEDMSAQIKQLTPFRWKVFQVLLVGGGNDEKSETGRGKKFDQFQITDEQYQAFCDRHNHIKSFIPEPNNVMAKSYLLLDDYMRFMDKGNGVETVSESILDVPVEKALSQVEWDVEAFENRGGVFDWRREAPQTTSASDCGRTANVKLEW